MDLLEPGGRKFVELGSGSPPEEEGADAAITPETLCQSALKLGHFPPPPPEKKSIYYPKHSHSLDANTPREHSVCHWNMSFSV